MQFSNSTYNTLKWVAQILLPALAVFYIAVAPLWGFPKQEEVAGTIMALDLLLGTLLGISNANYKRDPNRFDGEALIKNLDDNTKGLKLVFDGTIEELAEKDEIVFKVDTNPPGMDYELEPPE